MRKTVLIRHEQTEWTDIYKTRLTKMFPDMDFLAAHSVEEAIALGPRAHAIIGIGPQMPPALIRAMGQLEWIMSMTTGVDSLLAMEDLPPGLPISRVLGVHGPQMTELALMLMLSLARDLPGMLQAQARRAWVRRGQPLLYGKTLCLLGLGNIAETLARVAKTLEMRVTGVSDSRTEAPNVDRIYSRAALHDAAAEADFLVVLVPLSDSTRNIVDAGVLRAMKRSGFLLNLARGGCVDEAALIAALKAGEIAGAGVDVYEQEPLPPDDPIRDAPNVILTPHIGGMADIYHEQCFPIVVENLKTYAAHGAGALKDTLSR